MQNETAIDRLRAKRQSLQKQIEHIDAAILMLQEDDNLPIKENNKTVSQDLTTDYSKYSLKEAVYLYVKNANRFIGTKDVAEGLMTSFEKTDVEKFRVQVSGLISSLGSESILKKYQYGNSLKDTVWGLPAWLGEDGKPIENKKPIIQSKPSIFDSL